MAEKDKFIWKEGDIEIIETSEWWRAFPTIMDPKLGEIPVVSDGMTDEQKKEVEKIVQDRIDSLTVS